MPFRDSWARLQSLGFWVFLAVVGVGAFLLFVPLWHQRIALQREIRRLNAELAAQEALEKQQRAEIEAFKNDPAYVERVAREKLNLAKPGETIFRFESPTGTVPVTTAPNH